jgi:hypothetical protein
VGLSNFGNGHTVMAATAGASSSILEGAEPPSKKTHSKAYLLVSSRYVCVEPSAADVTFLLLSSFLSSKNGDFWAAGSVPRQL